MYYIYGLFDPVTGQLHYIGCTINMALRAKAHLSSGENIKKTAWIEALRSKELVPIMRCIDTAQALREASELEEFYISYFRMLGVSLFNSRHSRKYERALSPNVVRLSARP